MLGAKGKVPMRSQRNRTAETLYKPQEVIRASSSAGLVNTACPTKFTLQTLNSANQDIYTI